MNINDLITYLDNFLCAKTFIDYGPNGLQVGSRKEKIKKIATAVTADLPTIQAAIQLKANVLIVHHGLFWKGQPYPITDMLYTRMQLLMQHGIQLLAYHLPLDAHQTIGNNWKVARDLQWCDLSSFGSSSPCLGVKGSFPSISIEDFIESLSSYYSSSVKATALFGKKHITSASLISGGAYKDLSQAALENIDCFITGNFDEPAWSIALENQINFLAFGHTATEKVGPKALAQHLNAQLQLDTVFVDTDNPF